MSLKIYVAGAYSGENIANTRAALEAAERVWALGHVPFVPHLSGFWDLVFPHVYEEWLAYDIQWLRVCDGLLRLPGPSKGADLEEDVARVHGIPIYYRLADLPPSTGQLVGVNVNLKVKLPEQAFDNPPQEVESGPDGPSDRAIAEG